MLIRNSMLVAVGVCTVLAAVDNTRASEPTTVAAFGQSNSEKIRVSSSAVVTELKRNGGREVADYGSFTVLEVPAGTIANDVNVEVLDQDNYILLNAGPIDTTNQVVQQMRGVRQASKGKALHLIQFAGPIQPEWYRQLENTGVQIVTYIPSNSYLVYGDVNQLTGVQALSAIVPQVQWDGAYLDEYKIHPAVGAQQNSQDAKPADQNLYAIQLVEDAPANQATLAVIDRLKLAPIYNSYPMLNYLNVIVALPANKVAEVAQQPEVVSIQPYDIPKMLCERQDQIVAGNLTGNAPTGPGYLAWTGSKGFSQAQFTTSAFVVDLSDSPIDQGNTTPNHFGLWEQGVIGGTSHVAYARTITGTTVTGPPTQHGCDGHGNLNAHIIGGYDNSAGFPFADALGFHYGLGVCPFVKVGSSVIFNTSGSFTSPNYTTLQSNAYNNNARISSNSWGSTTSNAYTTDSQSYDALVRDSQPTGAPFAVAGNQEMVIVFANGNSGSGASTVRSPATAKNVISVGAAENVQTFGGTDGSGVGDSGSNSANDIINFSSRGPCPDGRKKPEIVAPGTHVSGGVAQTASPGATGTADACFTGSGVSGGISPNKFWPASQQFYSASSGTSHSTPGVAGGCAMIRQFFINQGLNPPSPAMTKAMLMNSARYMNGVGANDTLWSNSQGMGEMNLGEAFNRRAVTPTILQDEDSINMLFTASGQIRTFTGNVADNTKPFRVTLAWTDAPGPTSGNAYKNNLDLTVAVGGNTYKGNVFTGANSTTGGSADVADNAESVFLAAGVSGAFTVTVTATNINSDGVPNVGGATDQDFALVIYNASNCIAPVVNSISSQSATCGVNFTSSTPSTSSGSAPITWSLGAGAPAGMTINSGSGVVSWPTPLTAGSPFTITTIATNGCGNSSSSWSLTVNANPPSINPISDDSALCGIAYSSAAPSASGGATPLVWSLLSSPAGMTINSSTGSVSWPSPVVAGSPFTISVQADSANSCGADSKSWTLTVNPNAPTINPIANAFAVCGASYSSPAPTTAGGSPPLTFSLLSGPAGMSIDPLTGAVTWPSPVATGSPFTITVQADSVNSCGTSSALSWQLGVVIGDFDADGLVTETDIPGFVNDLLQDPPFQICAGDINGDGFIDGNDIPAFNAALGL